MKNTSQLYRIYDEKMSIVTGGGLETPRIQTTVGLNAKWMSMDADHTIRVSEIMIQ
jgi:hypothetical protein